MRSVCVCVAAIYRKRGCGREGRRVRKRGGTRGDAPYFEGHATSAARMLFHAQFIK